MNKDVKVLLVGDDTFDIYVNAFYRAYIQEGYSNTQLFATNRCLNIPNKGLMNIIKRAENKLAYGPHIAHVNFELLKKIDEVKPQLVFLYTARLIFAKTIAQIKKRGITVFVYNNDDPFGTYFPKYFWRHYIRGLKYADWGFVYRLKNIPEYKEKGCCNVELLRSYYIKDRNYYLPEPAIDVPEVLFLGHHEDDEREDYIKALLDEKIKVGITKKNWEEFEEDNPYLVKLEDAHTLYNEMLNATEIAIVFLSKINNDTYTRRCFEIPAVKTLMIAPYTEDIASMFQENEEVVLYRNKKEFVEKIKYYLENQAEREQIASAGYERLMKDGHEIQDRVRVVMERYEQCDS